jgi:CheY-like chemotaxis protein
VAAASRERPDLILLDVMMPEVNGYEVLAKLRARPDTRDVPVVMLTALAQERDVERAVKAGVNGFVSKPFEPADLLACVSAALGGCTTRSCNGALSSGSGEDDAELPDSN